MSVPTMGGAWRQTSLLGCTTALTLIFAPSASAAPGTACHPHGYVLEHGTRTATVVRRRNTSRVYGCLKSRGRLLRLRGAIDGYALAGRFVAYLDSNSGPTETTHTLIVRDLVSNTVRHAVSPHDPEPADGNDDEGLTHADIRDIVLKRTGSVAWISCAIFEQRCFGDAESPYQVWRADSRGVRLLQESSDIRPRSLKLKGHRVSWRVKGQRSTATLR